MIAAMDQLTVVGRRSVANDLLVSLQSLGVVQVDPLETTEDLPLERLRLAEADRAQKDGWDAAVARSAGLLDALGVHKVKPASRTEVPGKLDELTGALEAVGKNVDTLLAERGEIRDELDVVGTYLPVFRDLAPTLAQFDDSRYLFATAFAVAADALEATLRNVETDLDGQVVFSTRPRARDVLVVAVVLKSDEATLKGAVSRAGYAELTLPEQYAGLGVAKAAHTMEERSQALPKRLQTVDADLAKLAEQHGPKLATMNMVALNHQSRFERLEDMAEGRYSFALRGWVPSEERARVVEAVKKQFGDDVVVAARHADDHHDYNVPVRLDNPGWVKPFEGLLALFAPPKYGNFDPSWTLAVFFPLFFGVVIGDMGFGLLFAALALWMRGRGAAGKELSLGPLGVVIPPGALRPISTIILWCAVWGIVWGFLYGEFFGNFLEYWPHDNPVFYIPGELHEGKPAHGLIPVLIPRVVNTTPILLLSLGFGILQVVGGWAIRVVYGFKHHDMKHVWEGVGMIGGLVGLIVFAAAFLMQNVTPLVTGILIAGFVIFFLGMIMSRVFLMLIEIASNAGNILSYLRLFAVGLSAALVANLATGLGFALGDTLPIIGPILGILVALAVHFIAITLTIIGHTLQPLRLNYVEFFTKFGFYDESGRPYAPFRLLGGRS